MKAEYNLSLVQRFISDFNKITHLHIAMFVVDKQQICSSECDCSRLCALIGTSKEGCLRCLRSTTNGLREAEAAQQKIYSYRCHLGLIENAFPIFFESEIAGYIIFGQLLDGTEGERETIKRRCAGLIEDKEMLNQIVDGLQMKDLDYVNSAARILLSCIQSSLFENMIKIRKDSMWLKIVQFIDDNLCRKITIEDIARHVYCSASTVSHKTRKITGLSVCELIKQRRLGKAIGLLATTDYKINEIARMVSIDDYNYFSRAFRSVYGYAPIENRKSIQG